MSEAETGKWFVGKNRCRRNYRCCPPNWHAYPPGEGDSWAYYEFPSHAEAYAYALSSAREAS